MNWLLPDGKLCIMLFIVGDSGCETEAGCLVIVLVGKPLKANGSGDIIPFELKLIFCFDLLFYRDMSLARQNICYCHIFLLEKCFD